MERIYLNKIIEWNKSRKKPLLVSGARQIGKTYLIKELFAERYYKDNYIYVDFKKDSDIRDFILGKNDKGCSIVDPKRIIEYLSLKLGKEIDKNTLLIFDEVQEALPLITSLKYFKQDYPEIPVIVSGSMVIIKMKRQQKIANQQKKEPFFFPIGAIEELNMYPMNFEEFLMNYNKVLFERIKEAYLKKESIPPQIHDLALEALYNFLLVGGLPENVDLFLKGESLLKVRENIINIFNNYLNDMDLYQASSDSIVRTKLIFNNIYSELNKESKNFKASLLGERLKTRDLLNPIDYLLTANTVYKSSEVKEYVTLPFTPQNESSFRLYLMDTGFLAYQSDINMSNFIDNNKRNTLSGVFFENYIACELVFKGLPLYYWKGKDNSEFEFLVNDGNNIIPLDVKKGKGTLNSLKKYRNLNRNALVIKFSKNNYGFDETNKIMTIPLYMAFLYFNEILEKKNKI